MKERKTAREKKNVTVQNLVIGGTVYLLKVGTALVQTSVGCVGVVKVKMKRDLVI